MCLILKTGPALPIYLQFYKEEIEARVLKEYWYN